MNYLEMVDRISDRTKVPALTVRKVVECMREVMLDALAEGDHVVIDRLFKMTVKHEPERYRKDHLGCAGGGMIHLDEAFKIKIRSLGSADLALTNRVLAGREDISLVDSPSEVSEEWLQS